MVEFRRQLIFGTLGLWSSSSFLGSAKAGLAPVAFHGGFGGGGGGILGLEVTAFARWWGLDLKPYAGANSCRTCADVIPVLSANCTIYILYAVSYR